MRIASVALALCLLAHLRAQDPLKPPPIVINSEGAPEQPLPPRVTGATPERQGPPSLGGDETESMVEAGDVAGRIATKDAKDRFDEATPEPLWRRLAITIGLALGGGVVLAFAALRVLRKR